MLLFFLLLLLCTAFVCHLSPSLSLSLAHTRRETIPYVRMYNSYVWFNSINFSFTILCLGFFSSPSSAASSYSWFTLTLSHVLSRSLALALLVGLDVRWPPNGAAAGADDEEVGRLSCLLSLALPSLSPHCVPLGFYSIHVLCFLLFCFVFFFCLLLLLFFIIIFFPFVIFPECEMFSGLPSFNLSGLVFIRFYSVYSFFISHYVRVIHYTFSFVFRISYFVFRIWVEFCVCGASLSLGHLETRLLGNTSGSLWIVFIIHTI